MCVRCSLDRRVQRAAKSELCKKRAVWSTKLVEKPYMELDSKLYCLANDKKKHLLLF